MYEVAVYDTKSYDREFLERVPEGKELSWRFFDFRLSPHTAMTAQGAQSICIFVNDTVNRPCLEALSEAGVKLIALRCAGYNNVDLAAANDLHLKVVRVPSYSPHAIAEHTIGLLLALNRKIHRSYNRVRDLNFSLKGLLGFDINGKVAGIVGAGKIGRIVAQILRGFNAEVLVYDACPDLEWAGKYGVQCIDFATLIAKSDIISLHVPLLPETFHLINEKVFESMKPGVFLINTSRGKVIDTTAMIKALKSGRVRGVALDTYEEEEGIFFEDLSDQILMDEDLSRLLTFPNVLITAHQAFFTYEALEQIAHTTVTNIQAFSLGAPFLPGTLLTDP